MPPTIHGTISPHLAAPTYRASPHGPISHYISFTTKIVSEAQERPHSLALSLRTIPVEPHCLFSLQLPHNQLSHPPPATMAPYPIALHTTTTSSSLQMQMTHSLPVKPLTPTLKEDLLSGEPSSTSGATSLHRTNGNTTTEAVSFCRVYMSTFLHFVL